MLIAAIAAAVGLTGSAQQAQQKSEPPPATDAQQATPVFRTGINYVRVDAIVTDKAGKTVSDLKATDFEVVEDNKPQVIDAFKLVKLDGGALPTPDGPPRQIRNDNDEELEAARDDVRLFAIFLDDYHVTKLASLSVRDTLSNFIDTNIGPSDMLGVMYPLTPVSAVRMGRNHDATSRAMQTFVGRRYDYTPKNEIEEQYVRYPAEAVEQIRNQVSLSALRGLIVHMGSLKEGRKAIILVSEGYSNTLPPQLRDPIANAPGLFNPDAGNPLAGTNDPLEDRYSAFANFDMQQQLRDVFSEANRNNVSIYAIDPRGLATSAFDIEQNIGPQLGTKYLNDQIDTLRTLAEQTDGRAIVNRNSIGPAMKQIVTDSSAYYLIGYNSTLAKSDGKFHEIKVRVKRPGLTVRARKGYWALTPEAAAKATAAPKAGPPKAVEAALEAVIPPSRSRVIRTWIGTSRGENGKTRITFVWEPVVQTPGDRSAAGDTASRVQLTASGEDGTPYFRGRVPDLAGATAAAAPAANGGLASRPAQRVTFEVKPGKLQLRVAAEGSSSQVLDSETREITVPDLTASQTTFGTPEVLRARNAREFQQLVADPEAVPIAGREFSRTDRLLIRVPVYAPGSSTPALSVHLLNRAGQAMSELKAAASSRSNTQQIELPLAALAPGEYLVEIKTDGENAKELVGFRVTG
jgi:VWFA-related protein